MSQKNPDTISHATDWTKYYSDKKSWFSTYTQQFTLRCVLDCISKYLDCNKIDIMELGGGNSCFAADICKNARVGRYDIADNNGLAIQLFERQTLLADEQEGILIDLSAEVQNEGKEKYDFVYSIGLIEHFRGKDIKKVIDRHFDYVKSGGIVLVSFPTPTLKYRITRKLMELMHVWKFYDEKPLCWEDVQDYFELNGDVKGHYINRKLPLTQMLIIVRK